MSKSHTKKKGHNIPLQCKSGKQAKGVFTHMGWSLNGRRRYNDICEEVKKMHGRKDSKEKDSWVLNSYSEDDGVRRRKRKSAEMEQWEKEKKEIAAFEPASGFD